ncbi:hypothetical protein S40288_01881 [Stachybotrys chartarum IBT 40288]|nr:hypothetical protein S40288_01881 [Stachybotrys chartarum IBT 40288]
MERHVRRSRLVEQQGFALGRSALLLEAKAPLIKCMMRRPSTSTGSHQERLGRSLLFVNFGNRVATGGVMISVDGANYQLTVAHILQDAVDDSDDNFLEEDLDQIFLDDVKDEIISGSDNELQFRRGSGNNSVMEDTAYPSTNNKGDDNPSNLQSSLRLHCKDDLPPLRPLEIPHASRSLIIYDEQVSDTISPNYNLDYLLIATTAADAIKEILSPPYHLLNIHNDSREKAPKVEKSLEIRQLGEIGQSVTQVYVVSSNGPVSGVLLPGTTSSFAPGGGLVRRMYAVELEVPLERGDCGSAVIDGITGHLYGYIVLGTPGTSLAYIISASDVFKDIQDRTGMEVSLDTKTHLWSSATVPGEYQSNYMVGSSDEDFLESDIIPKYHSFLVPPSVEVRGGGQTAPAHD